MTLVDWEDIPVSARKSPRKLFTILMDELGGISWNELSVIERRSMKKRYNVLRDYLGNLPPWEDIPVIERRSHKRLYKLIKSVYDGDYDDSPSLEGPPAAVGLQKESPVEEAEYP